MDWFVVDETKCRRDGICVAVCPVRILEIGGDEFPRPLAGAAALCIRCGHCVAACPYGACSLDSMPSDACPPVRPEWHLSAEQAEHFLRARRSIRAYREHAVEAGRIERLIRVARYAPTGHNGQPVRWLVVSGAEAVRGLAGHVADWMRRILEARPETARALGLEHVVGGFDAGADPICRHAPHLVVAHAPKADPTATSACTIALAYLELAAPSLGLGACWAGYLHMAALHWPPLQAALALPEGHQFCGGMMLGEPRYRYHRLPQRREPQITWR